MMAARPADRMYNCLPMYHSVGGVLAPGAVLVCRRLPSSFAKSCRQAGSGAMSSDWDCTIFQYIGELCRYLLQRRAISEGNGSIGSGLACGNGLAPEVWNEL